MATKKKGVYAATIEEIFFRYWKKGITEFTFDREEIISTAAALHKQGITKGKEPKNAGDVIYSYRHRQNLPVRILETQPKDKGWIILGAGDAKYRFRLNKLTHILPTPGRAIIKIPDATPEVISRYALSDEQALLAKIRYNRLVDIFLGITTYSLQNHLRTKVANYGQIEIDELYAGVDKRGVHYIVPAQAKGPKDKLGVIQTIQDVTYCQTKEEYKRLICRAVSSQTILDDELGEVIVMFELEFDGDEVTVAEEKHYCLVPGSSISDSDLARYGQSHGG